jgi:hypothetical protein
MAYQFTSGWARGSVGVGVGLILIALLLAAWLGFASDEEFDRFSPAVRILAALVVSLVGLLVGGTMIVAGQLVSVLLDQHALVAQIHRVLTSKAEAGDETAQRR